MLENLIQIGEERQAKALSLAVFAGAVSMKLHWLRPGHRASSQANAGTHNDRRSSVCLSCPGVSRWRLEASASPRRRLNECLVSSSHCTASVLFPFGIEAV